MDLNIPKMGYFILYRNEGGFFGNAIEKEQLKKGFSEEDAKYTHVEVSGGGQWSVRVAPPSTKIADITQIYKSRNIRIYRYRNSLYEASKRYKVAFWAASGCNLRYDWLGVIRFKIKLIWSVKSRFFCSENSAWALQKEFPEALGKKPEDCMPADFTNLGYFEKVWEGELC